MMRRRMGRPGLVGTMARTAVVAGTASAVVGGMNNKKQAAAAQQQAAVQHDAETQARLDALETQGATPVAAPASGGDLVEQIQKLLDLKNAGALSEAEYEVAKAKVLAGA